MEVVGTEPMPTNSQTRNTPSAAQPRGIPTKIHYHYPSKLKKPQVCCVCNADLQINVGTVCTVCKSAFCIIEDANHKSCFRKFHEDNYLMMATNHFATKDMDLRPRQYKRCSECGTKRASYQCIDCSPEYATTKTFCINDSKNCFQKYHEKHFEQQE